MTFTREPFLLNKESVRELRTLCAELISDAQVLRMIAEDAGLDLRLLDLSGSVEAQWQTVIKEARNHGPEIVLALVDEVLERYRYNRPLREFWRKLSISIEPESPEVSSYTHDGWVQAPCRWAGYRLRRVIGRGGMGIVYRARVDSDHKPEMEVTDGLQPVGFPAVWVAIKLLEPKRIASPQQLRRFIEEMNILSQINHPNIVRLNRVGIGPGPFGDIPFLEMELIEGGSLDVPADAQPAFARYRIDDPIRALELVRKLAGALECLHTRHGFLHLDLKPSNVLMHDFEPKLTDFGLAVPLDRDSGTAQLPPGGTPFYCSPEQAERRPVGPQSDIFSLGVLFWRMLGGAWPPAAKPTGDRKPWLQVRDLETSEVFKGLPSGLNNLLSSMIAHDPADRPSTAQAIIRRCDTLLAELYVAPSRLVWEQELQRRLQASQARADADRARMEEQYQAEIQRLEHKLYAEIRTSQERTKPNHPPVSVAGESGMAPVDKHEEPRISAEFGKDPGGRATERVSAPLVRASGINPVKGWADGLRAPLTPRRYWLPLAALPTAYSFLATVLLLLRPEPDAPITNQIQPSPSNPTPSTSILQDTPQETTPFGPSPTIKPTQRPPEPVPCANKTFVGAGLHIYLRKEGELEYKAVGATPMTLCIVPGRDSVKMGKNLSQAMNMTE